MTGNDEKFIEIARAVADGEAVDWEAAEAAADDEGRRVVRHLRTLSEITGFHEGLVGSASALAAGDRWGPLEIVDLVAAGAFGEVYRARDPRLEREVALKLLNTANTGDAGAIEEARVLARIRHRNVVIVHGADIHDGRAGLWMEMLSGRTLGEIVREDGPFGAGEAALVGIDLCGALAAVHGAGIAHGDCKAGNVMREEGGRLVLMDFGLGRETGAAGGAARRAGTPLYMAPELFDGGGATVAADIYAAGVLLYNLVTGEFPVDGDTVEEIRAAHRERRVRSLRDARPDLPSRFIEVVERALSSRPADRFETAGELQRALSETLENAGAATVPARPAGRRFGRWASIALVAVAASVAVIRLAPRSDVYAVEAALYRAHDDAREELYSGSDVEVGDEIYLEIESDADLYAYVLNEDEEGESYLLFPLTGYELSNPLRRDERHRLPGRRDGRQVHWQVTSAGTQEHFFVITSREPVEEIEAIRAELPESEIGRPLIAAPIPEETVRRLRGVGGAVQATRKDAAGPADRGIVDEITGRLRTRSEKIRGVWMREIVLENRG